MRKTSFQVYISFFILCLLMVSLFVGCASIQAPTGGPRDTIPPKVIDENPKNFTTNFKGDEINIELDEYFKLENEFKEVSTSPAMTRSPILKIKKRVLEIKFQEPLLDSTTYTINFGNAIADNNEANILKNYVYVMSTGPKIDSLSISGTVVNTLNKEPVLDATVFLLPANQDSLFGKTRASIFTTTDSSGRYSLKYLKANKYNIYALKEEGGDKIYNSTKEEIAFFDSQIDLRKDTGNINLELFSEQPANFRLLDRKIEKDARLTLIFNKQLEKPAIQILQPAELNSSKLVEFTPTNDTAFVWLPSMEFDSINVTVRNLHKNLDTVVVRRAKRDTYSRVITIASNISSGKLRPGAEVQLTLSAPIRTIDGKKFTLLQDSVPVAGLRISRDSLSTRKINLRYPWRDEKNYILNIGDNAFGGTFGGANKAIDLKFTKDIEENYGVLSINATVPDTSKSYIVQLLNSEEDIITSNIIHQNIVLNYPTLPIGKYLIRIIYDENKNGKWDTGSVRERRQPEKVWNNPGEISLRANFDLEEKVAIPKPQ